MTIPINNRNDYTGNGAVATYSYTFKIYATTDLLVIKKDTSNVETVLVVATDYTVTGVGVAGGGSITLVAGNLPNNYKLTIRRVRPVTQQTDIRNQGAFYPEIHEDAFDHFVMIDQQQQDELNRSFKLSESINESVGELNKTASQRANKALIFAADGDLDVSVDDYNDQATDAAASAAAAATSASNASTSETNASNSAATAANQAAALKGTSTTSLLIAVASKTFTTQADKQFAAGQFCLAVSAADPTNYMHGQITSYSGTTLVVNVTNIGGSGTLADWNIFVSGSRGATGATGATGSQGDQGPAGVIPIATAGGTVDAITADYTPNLTLTDLTLCAFVASGANTSTTPTFAPDGLTAHTIVKKGGQALVAGDIPGALAVCILEYNLANTRWELLNPAVSAGGTSKWTALVATTDFSTTAASTSTITMATDQTANILVGYAIKFTLSAVVYYAQVTALSASLMTIRGAPLTTGAGDLTALSYSVFPSQVEVIDLSVDGYYEDATDSTLILNDMRKRLVWEESKAYIVGWDMSQRTVDTGTEANVTVMANAAAVGTANSNQGPTMSGTADTVVSTVVDISTSNYDINRGELLDVQATKAGNGNAVDMTLLVTVVYP